MLSRHSGHLAQHVDGQDCARATLPADQLLCLAAVSQFHSLQSPLSHNALNAEVQLPAVLDASGIPMVTFFQRLKLSGGNGRRQWVHLLEIITISL